VSDTRHHNPVPVTPPSEGASDADDAPTGVINRITGDWTGPFGDGSATGTGGSPASATGSPEGRSATAEPAPAPQPSPPGSPPGAHPTGEETVGGSAASPAADAQDKPPLPSRRRWRAAEEPGERPQEPSSGFDYFAAPPRRSRPEPSATGGWDRYEPAGPDAPTAATGFAGAFDDPFRGPASHEAPGSATAGPEWPEPRRTEPRWADSPWPEPGRTESSSWPSSWPGAERDASPASPAAERTGSWAERERAEPSWPDPDRTESWTRTDWPAQEPSRHRDEPGAADAPAADAWDPWQRPRQSGAAATATETAFDRPADTVHTPPRPAWADGRTDPPAKADRPREEKRERSGAPAGEAQQKPKARAAKKRDPYLDNAKFLLITLVPFGHALVPTLAADSARATYLYIYVFHMPLFVMISGYLSRNFWNSNAKTNKLVDTFLVPYVIVEVGYALLRWSLGQKWSLTITDPAWLNWYLIALLFWRLSTPVWKRMRFPVTMAIFVYLFAGFSELTGDFSMDRFFGLMPFFVIGLMFKPEWFDFLKRRWVQVLSVLVLIGAAAVAIYLVKNYHVKLGPIYYKYSYKDLGLVWWKGIALRMSLLIAALLMSAAVMSLVPRHETWFTDLGTRTLYCYLLHGVPVLIGKEMGWLSAPWLFGPLGVAAIGSASFALSILLCMPITRRLFRWLLEPRLTWLYRKPKTPVRTG